MGRNIRNSIELNSIVIDEKIKESHLWLCRDAASVIPYVLYLMAGYYSKFLLYFVRSALNAGSLRNGAMDIPAVLLIVRL